jgi:hypothetical protein
MNRELPKSIRSAFGRTQLVTTHPSADVLTAFAERSLSTGEYERVADHLAHCHECREVVFLASSVDEQFLADSERAAEVGLRPRPGWMPRFAWAVSGAVSVAIVGGILLQQHFAHDRSNQRATQVAQIAARPAPIVPVPETSNAMAVPPDAAKPAREPKAKPSEANKASHSTSEMASMKPPPPNTPESSGAAAAPPAKPVDQPPGAVMGGSAPTFEVAVPTQNGFAERPEGTSAQALTAGRLTDMSRAFVRRGATTWRITPEGHLEHFSDAGWISVLTDQPAKLTVVAESPNGVWAGGNFGELFHSEDTGAHWAKVELPIPPDQKNDAIVAIHFAGLQHGIILTESGARYSTSDGGKNWKKE